MKPQMNRIVFVDNPWPDGHAIQELEWSARIEPETGLWFELHLVSDDYYADDAPDEEEDVDEDVSDWKSKTVWTNYHACTLSSTYWDHQGFLVGTKDQPFDFATIGDRLFEVDPLPPDDDPYERAFGIYLLGHDGVADHKIRITPLAEQRYELDWRGKIAMEYVGDFDFDSDFYARSDQLTFAGIQLPDGTEENAALPLLQGLAINFGDMKAIWKDEALWLVPA